MTYQELNTIIAGIGLPYAYNEFKDGTELAPPFICFLFTGQSDDLFADNTLYTRIRPLTIELYTDTKDFELEARVEDALVAAGILFTRSEDYISSERMYQITYTGDVLITEE